MALTPITRSGSALQVGGVTKRFSGANMYWVGLDDNQGGTPGTYPTHTQITNAMQGAADMGGNLVRLHTVGISAGTSMSFETAPGTFVDANLEAADWAVYQAGLKGQYAMVPLTDIWNYYHGGMWNFVHWAYQQNPSGLTDVNGSVKGDSNNNQFFGNTTATLRIRTLFKAYISAWMNHVNQYNGIAYKDDPTIAIIETGNEIYSATAEWTNDIAQYIKSLAPNKLVADGSAAGGLVVSSAPGLNSSYVDILGGHYYAQDASYNLCGFTYKPSRYGTNISFIDQMATDSASAASAGKAFIVGEFPWTRSDVSSYYSAVESNTNIDGDMYWTYVANTDAGVPLTHGGAFGSDDYSVHRPYANTNEQTYAPALANHIAAVSGGSTTTPPVTATNLIGTTGIQHASATSYFTLSAGTLSLDTSVFQEGGSSIKITPAANDYPYWYATNGTQWAPVTPGSTYTAVASLRKNTATATGYHAIILWCNSAGSVLSTTAGSYTAGVNGSWVQLVASGTAPANAAYAAIQLQADTAHATTDTFNVDEYGVFAGNNTTWSASDAAVAYSATVALAGSGALTVAAKAARVVTVALSGSGALTAATKPAAASSVNLSGSGTLAASGSVAVAAQNYTGNAALTGAGSLTAATSAGASNTAALSGAGALTATGTPYVSGSASVNLSGTGSLFAVGTSGAVRTVALSGSGALTTTAARAISGVAALAGSGSLTATGSTAQTLSATVNLAGSGALTASTKANATRTANLAGSGALSVGVKTARAVNASLIGYGDLTVSASSVMTQTKTGIASLTGNGALTAYGTQAITAPPVVPGQPVSVEPDPTTINARTITGYSVQEDATPLDVSSTEGGVGSISLALPSYMNSIMLFDTPLVLTDDTRGITSGLVTGVNISGGLNNVSADSALGVLVGTTRALPKIGTFQSVASYYLSLGAISTPVYFDPSISDLPVSTSGWYGDAWLNLKQLAIANGVEIALVSNKIVFRPVRTLLTNIRRLTDFNVSLVKSDVARAVEIGYFDNFDVTNEVVYPRTADELKAAQVYQIEAGAVLEDDIQLTASLSSIDQASCVDDVSQDYDGNQSVYSVRAVDNSLVTAQQWAAGGGKLELTLNDDTTSVHIKITASNDQYYGPYRIAGRMKELDSANTTILPPGSANPNEASDKAITDKAKAAADAKAAAEKAKATKTTTQILNIDYPDAVDDYPWKHAATHGLSPLRYDYRDCTDFVAWRINRDSGHTKAPWKYTWANLRKTNGNAIGWKHDWELRGWKTGIAPVPGCIAWFGSSAGAYGHVAYVQQVNQDTVVLEEYNWGGNQAYHKRTVAKNKVGSFLASPAGSTKTIITTTKKADAAKEAVKTAIATDATANAAVADPVQDETDYNSLRIVGTGTLINKQTLVLPTGAAADRTATDVGVTVQNAYVNTLEDAYRVGVYVASRYKGEEHTISGTLTTITQVSGAGNILYKTIEQFNRTYDGMTIADFNAANAGKTIGQFDQDQRTDSIGTFFDNQVFGNVAGSRFKYANAMWRIDSTTITESSIQFSATRDTMIEEFNEAHADMTIADFNAKYAGKTMKQFGRIPLLGG